MFIQYFYVFARLNLSKNLLLLCENDSLWLFLLANFNFKGSNLMHYSKNTRLQVIYLSKLVFLSALCSNF